MLLIKGLQTLYSKPLKLTEMFLLLEVKKEIKLYQRKIMPLPRARNRISFLKEALKKRTLPTTPCNPSRGENMNETISDLLKKDLIKYKSNEFEIKVNIC